MSDLQRYLWRTTSPITHGMIKSDVGQYVKYEDAQKRIKELGAALESMLSEISRLQATLDRIRSCQRYEISELDCDLVPKKKGIWMLADDVLKALEVDDD